MVLNSTFNYRDTLLPYRGTIHDLGRSLTHKVEIIRLYEQGYLEPEIGTMLSPAHKLSSVERYIQSYKNILKLLQRKFSPLEISGILSMSKSLVVSYVEDRLPASSRPGGAEPLSSFPR